MIPAVPSEATENGPPDTHATSLKLAGADVKDAQAQMRHSHASTMLDIYQQFVPESQMRVVERFNTLGGRIM